MDLINDTSQTKWEMGKTAPNLIPYQFHRNNSFATVHNL